MVLELAQVEIDYCAGCGGVWLDGGELELLLGDRGQTQTLLTAFRREAASEKSRCCPLCRKKMTKVRAGADNNAPLIDECVGGEGFWFDRGELEAVIERGRLDPDQKVIKLLAELFGK